MTGHTKPERFIGTDSLSRAATLVSKHAPNATKLLIVADEATWAAAGQKLHGILAADYNVTPHILPRPVRPTLEAAEALARHCEAQDLIFAVGAGTLNDLCKYAAHQVKRPYIVAATAASMNGYSSATASLEHHGIKQSYKASPPIAILADLQVVSTAPKRLARAGLGDTLCRTTVEVDMLISHHLLGTPYPKAMFEQLRHHEAGLLAGAGSAREGDITFNGLLMHALIDAGDAMAELGSSSIASQGEHMIAHTLEMMYGPEIYDVYHGELIAITTLTMSRLQHKMMLSPPSVRALPRDEKLFLRTFGKKMNESLFAAYHKKVLSAETAIEINARLEAHWKEIKAELMALMIPTNTLERIYLQIGLPTVSKSVGLDEERYRNSCNYSYLTRDRFGFLDLAAMNDKRVF